MADSKARRRRISLSRSTPNLARLITTDVTSAQVPPTINLDAGTPRASAHSIATATPSVGEDRTNADVDADATAPEDVDSSAGPSGLSRSRSSTASSSASTTASSTSSNNPRPGPMLSRSLSHHHLTSFAPPFYNRPPTPLPPSPSLTSLLRPSFSTTNSRPTTPDDSENDTANLTDVGGVRGADSTEAAVAQSARRAQTVPRAAPKVPTYEYYGFVLYLTSSLCFLIYLLWSYLPSPFLHQLGIYYYPNRWWSLAIPAFIVMAVVYIYVALASYNTEVLTLPLQHIGNIVDDAAHVAVLDEEGRIIRKKSIHQRRQHQKHHRSVRARDRNGVLSKEGAGRRRSSGEEPRWDWRNAWNEGTDAVMDVPIGGVCEVLFGGG